MNAAPESLRRVEWRRGYAIRVTRADRWSLLHGFGWRVLVDARPFPHVWAAGTAMTRAGARRCANRAVNRHLDQHARRLRAAR